MAPNTSPPVAASSDVSSVLADNHRRFLAFLQRRVPTREIAEDILQDAFVRGLTKAPPFASSASSVAWFYRVLRNAIIDHHRRTGSAERRTEAFAREEEATGYADDELHRVVCKCIAELTETLKPEYASALRRVEVEGVSVKDYADEAGISANNAGVRIFRAREALRKQVVHSCGTCATHGCLDCTCDAAPRHGTGHVHGDQGSGCH